MKKTVSLILLIIFGCLFGLLLFEVAAYLPLKKIRDKGRTFIKLPDAANLSRALPHDKLLGWKEVPGTKGQKETSEFKYWVTINSKGFRDKEHSYASEGNPYRIVVLGDSFVWGMGVKQEDRFTEILESLLKNKGTESEVINLGIGGYGTDQEYLLFQSEGIKYKPNLVIMAFYSNDFETNTSALKHILICQKPVFRLTKAGTLKLTNVPVPEITYTKIWLMNHSSIYYLYEVFLLKSKLFRNLCIMAGLIENEERFKQQVIPLTKELLRNFLNLVKQNDSDFLVVLIPDYRQMENIQRNGDFTIIAAFIKNELKSHVLDLRDLLFKDVGKYYYKFDQHWTPEGHRIAAEAIFNYLIENGFFQRHSANNLTIQKEYH